MDMNQSRRKFIGKGLKGTLALGIAAQLPQNLLAGQESNQTVFTQTPLPYGFSALEPHIDAMTMEIHYTRHAGAYVKALNEAAAAEFKGESLSLETALAKTSSFSMKFRNNGGGHYNHEFFWKSMQPAGTPLHDGTLKNALNTTFGSYENFKGKLTEAALTRFGSGWAWLYADNQQQLQIGSMPNQDNPLMDISSIKGTPLLGIDVWEHAYYLKYQNKRVEYVNNWFGVINWKTVEARLAAIRKG
jgi:Fe-Mn family superoxide dismutase